MDTDDLSKETYQAVLITAERFHHDLTLQFGLLADHCSTDDDYLNKSEKKINGWLKELDLDDIIEDIFFEEPPNKQNFKKILSGLLKNISEVRKIKMKDRHYDF